MVIVVAIIIHSYFKYKEENYHIVVLVRFLIAWVLEFSRSNFSTIYLLNGWVMGMMDPLEISNTFESTKDSACAPPRVKAWVFYSPNVQDIFFSFHFRICHIIIFPRNMNYRFLPVFNKPTNFQRFRNRVERHFDFSFCLGEPLLAWNISGLRDK